MRGLTSAFAALSASLVVGTAAAQETARGWAADAFVPSERGSRWFHGESLDLRGHGRMALGAVGSYAYRPVAIRDGEGDVIGSPVRNHALLHTGAAFVFADRIRLGFDVPLQLVGDGDPVTIGDVRYSPASDESAVGDVRLTGDVRLFGRYLEGFTGAVGAQLFVPAGSPSSFTGDGDPHLRPRLMFAYESGSVALSAMGGAHIRGRDQPWAGGRVGSEVFVGVSGGAVLANGRIVIGPELLATTVVSGDAALHTRTTPVEVLLGTRWELLPKIRFGAGVGAGLTQAYGAPVARALLSIEWVPDDPRPPPPAPSESPNPSDRDGDGVPDPDDACGFVPGERSEFPERNGCPPPATAEPAPDESAPDEPAPEEPVPAQEPAR